jgi:two-component system, chemotaxis family, chemotaxis protein CheY
VELTVIPPNGEYMIDSSAMKNKNLLLVDDIASMLNISKSILRGAGFTRIYEAQDGVEALKVLKNKPIDLVICDWEMPNMNGLELFKEAQADEKLKDIPFLMLTASSGVQKVKEAIAAGVTDYIIKPYQQNAFIEKVISKL